MVFIISLSINAQVIDSQVMTAVKSLDYQSFEKVRNKISDYNMRDKNGDPLAIVLVRSYIEQSSTQQGDSALHYATMNNDVELVEKLLLAGASPWRRNSAGLSSLDIAENSENYKLVSLLSKASDPSSDSFVKILGAILDAGANVNQTGGDKKSLLYLVTLTGNVRAVSVVLSKNPKIDYRPSEYEETPLIAASRRGYSDIALLLLSNGADGTLVVKKKGETVVIQEYSQPEDYNAKIIVFSPSIEKDRRCYYRVLINKQDAGRTEIGFESQQKTFTTFLSPNTYLLSLEKYVLDENKNSYVKVNNIEQLRPSTYYFDTRSDRIVVVTVRHDIKAESTYYSEYERGK